MSRRPCLKWTGDCQRGNGIEAEATTVGEENRRPRDRGKGTIDMSVWHVECCKILAFSLLTSSRRCLKCKARFSRTTLEEQSTCLMHMVSPKRQWPLAIIPWYIPHAWGLYSHARHYGRGAQNYSWIVAWLLYKNAWRIFHLPQELSAFHAKGLSRSVSNAGRILQYSFI